MHFAGSELSSERQKVQGRYQADRLGQSSAVFSGRKLGMWFDDRLAAFLLAHKPGKVRMPAVATRHAPFSWAFDSTGRGQAPTRAAWFFGSMENVSLAAVVWSRRFDLCRITQRSPITSSSTLPWVPDDVKA